MSPIASSLALLSALRGVNDVLIVDSGFLTALRGAGAVGSATFFDLEADFFFGAESRDLESVLVEGGGVGEFSLDVGGR